MLSSIRQLVISFFLLLLVLTLRADDDVINESGSDELKSENHKIVLAEMKKILDGTKIIRQRATSVEEELVAQPILNWDDVPRGHHHGALWIWGKSGRPAAIIETFTRYFENRVGVWPGNAVHSLAPEPLRVAGPLRWDWAPTQPGFTPQELTEVPVPAATNKLRRTQMKSIARRFTANETYLDGTTQLRLLPTPVYLYDSAADGILEGGLFVFVHGGTNPEVVLILEAIERDDKKFWQFGCVRLAHAQVQAKFDDREVWNVELYGPHHPDSCYYTISPQ